MRFLAAEGVLIGLGAVVVLGILAQWVAWRLGFPSILLLLLTGFVAGPILGILDPDALLGDLLLPVVSISVGLILFEGGMSLNREELRTVGRAVRNLISVGIVVTWLLASVGAYLFLDLGFGLSVLLGAIFIVTGPTVIIPLLRQVRPRGEAAAALKWEGILNDPIGAVIAVLVFEVILTDRLDVATFVVLSGIFKTVVFGSLIGVVAALAMVFVIKRNWVPDFLESPVTLMMVVLAFVLSDLVQPESGLLATTLMGVVMANQRQAVVHHIVEFKENLGILLLSGLFILLSARLETSEVIGAGIPALLFLGWLVIIVRPATVFVSTLRSGLDWRARAYLAAMAPRGIVAAAIASVFALRLTEAGVPGAESLAPAAFVVIIGTVAIYGLAARPFARALGLASPHPQGVLMVGAHEWARKLAKALHAKGFRVVFVDSNRTHVHEARREGLHAYRGSVLSERVEDDLDLQGIGRFVALTPNDEVNSLGALHFREIFGRAEVYQLEPRGEEDPRKTTPRQHLRGRILFAAGVTYQRLEERFERGDVLRRVKVTLNQPFEEVRKEYGDRMLPLFLFERTGGLAVMTAHEPPAPRAGDEVLVLVEKEAAAEPDAPWEPAPEAVPTG